VKAHKKQTRQEKINKKNSAKEHWNSKWDKVSNRFFNIEYTCIN